MRAAAFPATPEVDTSLVTPRVRDPIWRRASAGVTPRVIAIIAVLLVVRNISATVDLLRDFRNIGDYLAWLVDAVLTLRNTGVMAAVMLVVIVATSNLAPPRGPMRIAALACGVLGGTSLGVFARMLCGDWFTGPIAWHTVRGFVAYIGPRYLLIGALFTIVAELYRRERANIAEAQQAEFDSIELGRDLAAAQLEALEAQIEPHFLFNTLANARRLYEEDPAAGRTMLDMLMRYIEVTLPEMRRGDPTLAREGELVEAYLHIQRVRMGPRLAFGVDIPHELAGVTVPPMMLLTLVENAVKHGLTASTEGGRVHVTARHERGRLVLTVADTGVGFGSASGTGTGLANISARLASQFGDRAALILTNNEFGGATASIVLPVAAAIGPA